MDSTTLVFVSPRPNDVESLFDTPATHTGYLAAPIVLTSIDHFYWSVQSNPLNGSPTRTTYWERPYEGLR